MEFKDYLEGINRTWNKDSKKSEIDHCRLAIMEEVGEIIGWYKKIHGYKREKTDEWKTELKGEFGDLIYYVVKLFEILDETEMIAHDFKQLSYQNVIEIEHVTAMSRFAVQASEFHNHEDKEFVLNSLDGLFDFTRMLIVYEGLDFEDVLLSNLLKLQTRHGSDFDIDATVEKGRDREAESESLNLITKFKHLKPRN